MPPVDPKLSMELSAIHDLDDFALSGLVSNLVAERYWDDPESDQDQEEAGTNCPEALYALQLSRHWWIAFLVHDFVEDVLTGGLEQFFDHHESATFPPLSEALQEIGAEVFLPPFRDAVEVFREFENSLFNVGWESTEDFREQTQDAFEGKIAPMNQAVSGLLGQCDPRACLARYIRENLALYRAGAADS